MTDATKTKFYFVDESGDGTLFNDRGTVLVGTEGCSRFFVVGLLDVADESALHIQMEALRTALLQDPFLKRMRQLQPERKQTALAFHAKDDPVEVRREVFALLLRHDVRFSAVVKSKIRVTDYVRNRNRTDSDYRYHPNELYDFTLRRLFRQRLHKHDAYHVTYAIRGSRERSTEFKVALESARDAFVQSRNLDSTSALTVEAKWPRQSAGLQAVDYFLWALQRVYERPDEHGNDRYLSALWEAGKISLVVDMDDTRDHPYGRYYTEKKPLFPAALPSVEGYRNG